MVIPFLEFKPDVAIRMANNKIQTLVKKGKNLGFYMSDMNERLPFTDGVCLLVPPDKESRVNFTNNRDATFEEIKENPGKGLSVVDWDEDIIAKVIWHAESEEDGGILSSRIHYLVAAVNGRWVEDTMHIVEENSSRVELRSVQPFPVVLQRYMAQNIGREDAPCIVVDVDWDVVRVIVFFEVKGDFLPVFIRFLDGAPGSQTQNLGINALLKNLGKDPDFEGSLYQISGSIEAESQTEAGRNIINRHILHLAELIQNTWRGCVNTHTGTLEIPPVGLCDVPIFVTGLLRYPDKGIRGLFDILGSHLPRLKRLTEDESNHCEFDHLIFAMKAFHPSL